MNTFKNKKLRTLVVALTTLFIAASLILFIGGCQKKDNGPVGPPAIEEPVTPLTLNATLGTGSWNAGLWTVPVVITDNVIDLRAMSVKVTVSPNSPDFTVIAGTALSKEGANVMMMSAALPTYVQIDWATGAEKGWAGKGEVVVLRFNTQVNTSLLSWKAYDSNGNLFHANGG